MKFVWPIGKWLGLSGRATVIWTIVVLYTFAFTVIGALFAGGGPEGMIGLVAIPAVAALLVGGVIGDRLTFRRYPDAQPDSDGD